MEIGGIIVGGGRNIIYGNMVKDSLRGLVMYDPIRMMCDGRNLVFHNNFINNAPFQAVAAPIPVAENRYDDGYPSGGNYWSNYDGADLYCGRWQNETGSDGIGDAAFTVFPESPYFSGIVDHYPLMAPIEIFDVDAEVIEIVSNCNLSNFNLDKTRKRLSFNATNINGEGFCRITIPNIIAENLWQNNYIVFVNNKIWSFTNWTSDTNTYIYINSNETENEIMIIPEFPTTTTLLTLLFSSLIATKVWKTKKRKQR